MLLLLAFLLLVGAIAALGAALVRNEAPSGVARALEALERHGSADAAATAEVDPPFADRILEPLQQRALTLGRRITGTDKAERIRHRLDLAGNPHGWTVDRVVSLKVMAGVILPLAAVAYCALVTAPLRVTLAVGLVAFAMGFFGPDLYLYNTATHRAEEIKRSLADAIDLLTISVEAGLGFDAAVQQVARNTEGALAEEFARVLREMQLGKGRSDALRGMSERSSVEDLHAFASAMVQADAFGISLGQVLRVQSEELRLKRRQYAEEKAQQVPVKIMVPLILFILPCLFVVIMGPAVLNAIDAFTGG